MNSNSSSTTLSLQTPKKLPWWMLFVSILGFFDASYLALEHFLGRVPPCSIVEGCEEVTTSVYATIGGVPVALLGALYYLLLLVLLIVYLDTKRDVIMRAVPWITIAGFLASLYFVYLQLFVINAICIYCMVSALTSTTLFVLGMSVLKGRKSI